LGNVGTVEDVTVLQQALEDPESLVREHAARAILALTILALDRRLSH
jgi:HEAT repeat protein